MHFSHIYSILYNRFVVREPTNLTQRELPDKSVRGGGRLPFEFRRSVVLHERTAFTTGASAHGTKNSGKPNCNRQPPFDLNSPEVEYKLCPTRQIRLLANTVLKSLFFS